jgi:hypothetical protein
MYGLETIQRLNAEAAVARVHTAALHTPCEADELKDIGFLVALMREHTTQPGDWRSRAADYLVAAYGIEE